MVYISPDIVSLIDRAVGEDAALNDITTGCLIPQGLAGKATINAKATGILAGIGVALAVLDRVDPSLNTNVLLQDGAKLEPGAVVANIEGPVSGILRAERTMLNFLQHMSGIATETARYVEAVEGFNVAIVDTRKTTPGLRQLEKYSVEVGGGKNHRINLMDGLLIKDNHIAILRAQGVGLTELVRRAVQNAPHTIRVEVEVTNIQEAQEALDAGAEILLLDNMSTEEMRKVVSMVGRRVVLEASGNITLDRIREVAETGVDLISVGALTHSSKALDVSLELVGS